MGRPNWRKVLANLFLYAYAGVCVLGLVGTVLQAGWSFAYYLLAGLAALAGLTWSLDNA